MPLCTANETQKKLVFYNGKNDAATRLLRFASKKHKFQFDDKIARMAHIWRAKQKSMELSRPTHSTFQWNHLPRCNISLAFNLNGCQIAFEYLLSSKIFSAYVLRLNAGGDSLNIHKIKISAKIVIRKFYIGIVQI